MKRWIVAVAMMISAVMAVPYAIAGDDPASLAALSGLEPGQWELHSRDPGEATTRLCIKDFQQLIQLRHQGQVCKRFVVEDTPGRASVSYTCPRTGHGLTVMRMETARLVQIDSQGVADGYPFALNLEARRTGVCSPMAKK